MLRSVHFNDFGYTALALMLLTVVSGCQQRSAGKLLGRWEGRPESAAARADREAEKYGDTPQTSEPIGNGSGIKSNQAESVTDWEKYDVTIVMDFVSSDRVEMSLGDGTEKRAGTWQIVVTSPTGCVIEVQTEVAASEGQEPSIERRRFELILDERDGDCVGFLLTEVGADRQLGALYFKRPE